MRTSTIEFEQNFSRLEAIFEATTDSKNYIDTSKVLTLINKKEILRWERDMESQGLLQSECFSTVQKVRLTPKGFGFVKQGIKMRKHTRIFLNLLAEQLFEWVCERSQNEEDFWDVCKSTSDFYVYGRNITPRDLLRSANVLQQQGLIKCLPILTASSDDTSTTIIQVSITAQGKKRGKISFDINWDDDNEEDMSSSSGATFKINNMYGGNVVAGDNNKISSTVSNQNIQKLIEFGEFIRKVTPVLDLDDSRKAEVYEYASALEGTKDPSKLKSVLEKLKTLALSSASDSVMGMIADRAVELLQVI